MEEDNEENPEINVPDCTDRKPERDNEENPEINVPDCTDRKAERDNEENPEINVPDRTDQKAERDNEENPEINIPDRTDRKAERDNEDYPEINVPDPTDRKAGGDNEDYPEVYVPDNTDWKTERPNEDYPDINVPDFTEWTAEEVADWISDLGFWYYKECFEKNFITGRRLVLLRASHLPQMGITIFEDIKILTAHIRKLTNTKLIVHSRSISLHPREPWALFLEVHSKTTLRRKHPNYIEFLKKVDMKHNDP